MEELKLDAFIEIFKKNSHLLIKIFLTSVVVLSFILAFFEPKYSINTSIIIEEKDDSMNVSPETMLLGGQSQKIANEIEIIKSRKVLDSVITELNLQYLVKKDYNFLVTYYLNMLLGKKTVQGSLNISSISGSLSGKNFDVDITDTGYMLLFDGKDFVCVFDKECPIVDGSIIISKLGDIDSGTNFSVEYQPFVKVSDNFSDSLEITPLGDSKSSNIFEARILTHDPFKTQLILDSVNKKYISTKVGWKSSDADEQQKFLQKMLLDIKKDLNDKSGELAKYQKDNQTVMPDLQFTEIMKRNVEIEKDIAILTLQEEIVNKYSESIDIDSLSPVPAPVVIDDLSVQMTVKSHNELVAKEISQSATLTDNHPDITKTRSDIKQAKINLKVLLKKTSDNYVKSGELLKKQSNLIFSTIENLPKNLMNIAALERDVFITEKLYAFLAQKFYEAGINIEMNMSTIRILDEPTSNVRKFSPKLSVSLLIILFLSMFISVSYIITSEFLRKSVNSSEEIISILKTPYTIINTRLSNEIIKSVLDIGSLKFKKSVRKIAVYSLIPRLNDLSDVDAEILEKITLVNIIKTNGIDVKPDSLDKIKILEIESGGLNQFLVNKKMEEFFEIHNNKISVTFSQIGKEIIDRSFFELFDLFIIITSSRETEIKKLVETKAAIDESRCETISTIIINE